jgi:choline dehydrogenase-like flavoprotein
MKLWDKGYALDASIEAFTIGKDRELDLFLAPYDILGTMAHVTMLASVGMLTEGERDSLHDPRLPENLYVADATILPRAMGNPPILTIMALAKKIAAML